MRHGEKGRVLVTGASGFIGRHLCPQLSDLGHEVVAVSRSGGFDITLDTLPLQGVTQVIHLAARTGVPASWQEPVAFHWVNAHGTLRLLEQCRNAACPVLHVSAYIYGRPERMPIAEDAPIAANNPYAFSKFAAEQACVFYSEHWGLPVSIVRPFNVYGPGQDSRFLIPFIVEQAIDPARERIELLDLAPRRDYIYISDLIDAIIAVAQAGEPGTFNIGSGTSDSVAEVASKVAALAGTHKPVVAVGVPRQNEIADVRADIRRIRQATGWEPRVSLDAGLRRVVEVARQC